MTSDADKTPQVLILMGSSSDHDTMSPARDILRQFDVACEYKVASAHRAPEVVAELAKGARGRGIKVIIAGAGGAAHLPGVVAAQTTLPVIGVPVQTGVLGGLDSLLSIVQMPGGVPVATVAIGSGGAKNAGLLAVQILALSDERLAQKLSEFRESQTRASLQNTLV
ncbi:MAG: 5-(carboxyamino)imidazole ribonucleotide mutase [Deltaproteobacteria bacterium]|nr:5-(carboxyamino)imidazole ribonucleotide mutase [Deltaproteobacteria bacterium]